LRVLLYLAAHQERLVSINEISRAYGVSHHHLVKVVQRLLERDLIASTRGRGGGLRLNRPPGAINIGALVRATEPHFDLVECFDREANTCPIDSACGLKGVLRNAQRAFLGVLDGSTLADFVPRAPQLIRLWRKGA
jgi:Rrf2 family nitric oxide-sensitive transcriptional repressor